jgi:hypothetical protein
LWLPLAVAAAPVLMAAWAGWHVATGAQGLSDAYRLTANFLNSELGPVEMGTALILLFALVAGLRAGWLAVLDARNLLRYGGLRPDRDWILTRILWLGGEEPGANRFGTVDTGKRFIYIHGTPEVDRLGQPVSHGCVRMACADVEWLFDAVSAGTPVFIGEAPMDALAA